MDNQGKGPDYYEGRVEHHTKRALENAQVVTANKVSQLLPSEITPALPTGDYVSGTDNYSRHLALLEAFKTHLKALKPRLHEIENQYQQHIERASQYGFMENYTNPLRQKHQRFTEKLAELEAYIHKHSQQIEQQQDTIRHLQAAAQRG